MTTSATALERLLATEARLDAWLAEERARAETLLREAEEEAEGMGRSLDAELEQASRELEARLAAERDARLAFLEDEARRHLGLYQRVDAPTRAALAGWVVERVLAAAGGAA